MIISDISNFSIKEYLSNVYPTNEDEDQIINIISEIGRSLREKNANEDLINHFLETFNYRIRSISSLCLKIDNMDDCNVTAVENIVQSIDLDIKYILNSESTILKIENNYFLNLSALPDAVKFYKYLIMKRVHYGYVSRKTLEHIYRQSNLKSTFSNVLFALSWLNILRVYERKSIHFNSECSIRL
jgi:hypothetical protein